MLDRLSGQHIEEVSLINHRASFTRKAEEVLDFLDLYDGIRQKHLEKFFPDSKKVVAYLIKRERLHISLDGLYISTYHKYSPDKALVTSLSVLGDVFEKVKSHTRAQYPVQISFSTHSGDFYEIVYVNHGLDALVAASFEFQHNLREQERTRGDLGINLGSYPYTTKRLVIVENEAHMERLKIPSIVKFAVVSPDGELTYYKGNL